MVDISFLNLVNQLFLATYLINPYTIKPIKFIKMKTEKLTKTNLISIEQATEIEKILGTEIENVMTYKKDYVRGRFEISPYTSLHNSHFEFKNLSYIVKKVTFDKDKMQLSYIGRNRWQRKFETIVYQLEIVGYKLPTTKINEGWIYGNPIKLTN